MKSLDRDSMEEYKYYVPNIEDFHVGFEFELYDERGWNSLTFPAIIFDSGEWKLTLEAYIQDKQVRVKHLDRSDIESLGFKYHGRGVVPWYKKEGIFTVTDWTSFEIMINHDIKANLVGIFAMDCGDTVTLFQGIIKNKSELNKVLKMIVIPHNYENS